MYLKKQYGKSLNLVLSIIENRNTNGECLEAQFYSDLQVYRDKYNKTYKKKSFSNQKVNYP